jgi:hypothetical protein
MRALPQNIDSLGVACKIFGDKELEKQILPFIAKSGLSFIARTIHGGMFCPVE